MNRKCLLLIVINLILILNNDILAQEYSPEGLKSALIYNLGKYITWENEENIERFTIGIYGDDPLMLAELTKITNTKTLKDKSLEIIQFKEIEEISAVQILYVTNKENNNLFQIFTKISGNNTLLVTDQCESPELIMINFIIEEGKIRFKINNKNITDENLTILPKILLLGGTFLDVTELYKKSEKLLQDEKEKVEQQQREIAQQKEEIQQQIQEIEIQKNKINIQQILIASQYEEIDSQKIELNNLIVDIEKKQSELNKKLELIDEREKEIKVQQIEMANQASILQNQGNEIKSQHNQIISQRKVLNQQIEKIETQKLLLILFIVFIIMFLFLVFFILRGYKIKQTANIELRKKNEAINQQKEEILQQSEELIVQAERLHSTNEELEKQKNKIEETLENLKNTQTKLVQSEKMASIGVLTAGIAHEINNPINFINSGVNSLQFIFTDIQKLINKYEEITVENVDTKLSEIDNLKDELDYQGLIDGINDLTTTIKNGIARTVDIVKGLNSFSRLDENELKSVDIHENIEATLIVLRNQIKNKIKIIKDYKLSKRIECFPGKINQIFMNLLVNAIHAVGNEGIITISTMLLEEDSTNYACIKIKDTGKGMPDDVREKIFQPFFTTKDVGQGTGLGLSICYNIIKSHNGKINVESKIGNGTEFSIYLPIRNIKNNI